MIYKIKDMLAMRTAIAEFCAFLSREKVPENGVFNSRLTLNELVGNVLRHTDGEASFRGEIKDGFIELSVFSNRPFTPPKTTQRVDVYAEHGRGLFLVDSFCAERETIGDSGIFVKIRIE